jgi:uncharacterized protein (DUF1330 family)
MRHMPAYLIVDIARISDEDVYRRYRSLVSSNLQRAGGRYLARGGPVEVLEGDWSPNRIVLVAFDTRESAKAWWASAGYADLKRMRQASAKTNMIVVEGVAETGEPNP